MCHLLAEVSASGSLWDTGERPGGRGFFVDVDDDARTIGRRLRQVRHSRRKSLRVATGLAMVRGVITELRTRARPDSVGRELRGMAYRAGLRV